MKKWSQSGNHFSLDDVTSHIDALPVGVYTLSKGMFGFYLEKLEDKFEFEYKLYGLETNLINRVKKTWDTQNKNLGVLLNGIKGTGKTVTAKVIANQSNLPVILVTNNPESGGIPEFLSTIEQDVVVFIDEYEKIFGEEADLLTVMDGVLNSEFRRLFLLTTNKTYINDNLLQRPSRIRYYKTFKDLTPAVICEIVDDLLIHKQFRDETISAISNLEIITIDIVKAVVDEVNIHSESPKAFLDVFNVKKIAGRFTVFLQTTDEKDVVHEKLIKQGVKISPRQFNPDCVDDSFYVDDNYLGEIVEVLDFDTVIVKEQIEVETPGEEKPGLTPTGKKRRKPRSTVSTQYVNRVYRVAPYDSLHMNFAFGQRVAHSSIMI